MRKFEQDPLERGPLAVLAAALAVLVGAFFLGVVTWLFVVAMPWAS